MYTQGAVIVIRYEAPRPRDARGADSCFSNHARLKLIPLPESDFVTSLLQGAVIVIRYEGPKGGPGMPEMLTPTSAIMGAGLGKDCALITDDRFSGGSHGFVIGHVAPEAAPSPWCACVDIFSRVRACCNEIHIYLVISNAAPKAQEGSNSPG